MDLSRIPLAKRVPWAVLSQLKHTAVLPQVQAAIEGKQPNMSFCETSFVSQPVFSQRRN